ncbi:MAG: SIS domain-containing protein [Chloroflexi bacterium]|nr:SIS domain-containing protein [Chloroflexota bacterium]MCY4248220.1 SIS domain-containing protein [Chloroflexota bacterium]
MSQLQKEIAEQPGVIGRLLDDAWADTERAAATIRAFNPPFVCIAARGTSDNAARYAQYLFGHALGLPVMLATPSLHTLYKRPADLSRSLVIGISQSGAAEDVRQVLADARKQGALTLAITNIADSPLGATAETTLLLRAGQELSVAASKTYTSQLTVVAMLTAALADDPAMRGDLARLPKLAEKTLELSEAIGGWSSRYQKIARLVALGRGFNYATACEIALKIKELIYIASEGYSEADFWHGPIAAIDALHPVVLVAPSGPTLDSLRTMQADLVKRGADLLVISDDEQTLADATTPLPVPAAPEWLSPITCVMPGQIFGMQQALARGYAVDKPRGLSKVTVTE